MYEVMVVDSNVLMGFGLILLVFMSAFFSATETAVSSVNRIRLKNYADEGNKRAKNALYAVEDFDRTLSTILVGNNIVNIASSSIATVLAINLLGDSGPLVSTIVVTIIILLFGEILPKSLAKEYSEKIRLGVASILKFLIKVLYPITFFFIKIKNISMKLLSTGESEPSVTEQELKYIIHDIEKEGVLEEEESDLVCSALEFDEKIAEDILTPRVDIVAIDIDDPQQVNEQIILRERYSRIPVYQQSIDNIIGILHTRDYIERMALGEDRSIDKMIVPAYFIYKTKKLSKILSEFKKNKLHIAIVSDDYGGTIGMLTMEDLLEQIVGDIWDEDEEVEHKFVKIGENSYRVSADINVHDLFDFLEIYDRNFNPASTTLGGWVLEVMGKMPEEGEEFEYGAIKISVAKISNQRITTLIVTKLLQ